MESTKPKLVIMRVDDVIYFSPEIRAIDLDMTDKAQILKGFKSRIYTYYLSVAEKLNDQESAFASGVILMSAIDAITYYSIGGNNRIKDFIYQSSFLAEKEEAEKRMIMRAFDDYFRNGLIHEGRIKSGGQFSYSYTFLYFENGFLIINPRILQQEVTDYFERYLMQLVQHEGAYQIFYNKFFRQFNTEIQELKRLYGED